MSKMKDSFQSVTQRLRNSISARFPKLKNAFRAAAADGREELGGKLVRVAGATALGSAIALAVGGLSALSSLAIPMAVGAGVVEFGGAIEAAYRAYRQGREGINRR